MSLEKFYQRYGNIVLRGPNNEPSIFVKHVKQNSSDFDSSLPNHTHPAFVVNGVTDQAVLIGKYINIAESTTAALCSLPNQRTLFHEQDAQSYNQIMTWTKGFGSNVTPLSIYDHGLFVLLAHRNKFESHGNNNESADYRSGTKWTTGATISVGEKRYYKAWLYECLISHTTSSLITPLTMPSYWKKIKRVGGTPLSLESNYHLTGSGPLNWYFLNDIAYQADINGEPSEWVAGLRIYNGEIQIIPNNLVADPTTDISTTSGAWKAIKEDNSELGYSFVDPGTAGTIHYLTTGAGDLRISANAPQSYSSNVYGTPFKNIKIDTTSISTVPSILYELGLAPIPKTTVDGYVFVPRDENTYLYYKHWGDGDDRDFAGIGSLYPYQANRSRIFITTRSRARVLAST